MANFPNEPVPTQVIHPWRAALRSGFQALLPTIAILLLIAPMLTEFIEQFWPGSPAIAWIAGASLFLAALATLISRIMAIPAVNELLTRWGVGANPKS